MAFDDKPQGKQQFIRLHFAQPIKQVGPAEIEIALEPGPEPFSTAMVEYVCKVMGQNRGEIVLDEIANDIIRRLILDAVK